jgi:hypothetical protein
MIAEPVILPACACGRTGKNKRLPTGWKRHENVVYCDTCWRQRYLLRAIALPVASPVEITWSALRNEIKALWVETTRCCNWMAMELYARDIRRGKDDVKMPPMPKVYLYPEARAAFPGLPAQSVAALEQAMQKKYRARRYEVLWTRAASLPTCRYPTPFPVHNQSWHAMLIDSRPVVSVRLQTERRELRLKSGPQFRRQMEAFQLMARGEAVCGELAIYQQGDALMVKMVAWLPRPAAAKGNTGELRVKTAADSLLIASNAKEEAIWRYHGDHLRRWVAIHRNRLQRWSDDAKYENRPIPSFAGRREAAAAKFHHRMASAAHEIAAQLAGYARRRRFAAVEYNDQEQGFCPQFPWARLRALIAEKLDAYGIGLRIASASVEAKTPEALAEDEDAKES